MYNNRKKENHAVVVWSLVSLRTGFRIRTDLMWIRIQGFDDQKLKKIYHWKKIIFFCSKITFIPRPP